MPFLANILFQVENRILSKQVPTHSFSQILAHFARLFPSLWFVTDLFAGHSLGQDGNLCFLPTSTLSVLWSTLAPSAPFNHLLWILHEKKISQTYRLATLGHLANLPTLAENRSMNCICLMVHRSHSQEPRKCCGLSTPTYPSIFSSQLSMKLWPALFSQCEHSVLWTLTTSTLLFINKAHNLFTRINDVSLVSSTGTGTLPSASFRA